MHGSTCYVGEFHEILMSLYHCEGKLTKNPCKLLCLMQPTQHSDVPLCLASGRMGRYADVCTLAPEQFCLQESKVKPVLPTHFRLQDETPEGFSIQEFPRGHLLASMADLLCHRYPGTSYLLLSFLICPMGDRCYSL